MKPTARTAMLMVLLLPLLSPDAARGIDLGAAGQFNALIFGDFIATSSDSGPA